MSEEKNAIQGAQRDAAQNLDVQPQKTIDHALIARLVIREGKPWKESALAGGYSDSVASRGMRAVMNESSSLTDAFKLEEKRIDTNMARLKPLAINRLYQEIINANSSNGIKAIEVAGKFKETDWFVRQSETQIGLLIELADSSDKLPDSPIIDITKD